MTSPNATTGDTPVNDADPKRTPLRWAQVLVPDAEYRRHASDVVRVLVATFLIATFALITRYGTVVDDSFGAFAESLPNWLREVFRLLYALGSTFVVGLAIVVAVFRRRWRLVLTIISAVAVATVVVVLLYLWLDSGARTAADVTDVRSFPLRRLAISTAVLVAVRPFVVHPIRKVLNAFLLIAVVGAVLVPAGLPFDVLAGFVVGWGAAALTALAIGSPEGTPTLDDARATLSDFGIDAESARPAADQDWGEQRFDVVTTDGKQLDALVLGRDARNAQLLTKTWHSIWYRDSGGSRALDREHRVDQIGFIMMLAGERGASVPEVVTAGIGGPSDTALLLSERPPGALLAEVDPTDVSDELLCDLWRSTAAMRQAHLAHGSLDARHIAVDGDRGTLVAFTQATRSAPSADLDKDLAQLLVTQATIVGSDRAMSALHDVLGDDGVQAVLPVLQPAVLNPTIRKAAPDLKGLLQELSDTGSHITGTEPPELLALKRVTAGSIGMLALSLVGIWMIIGLLADVDWSELWTSLQDATWGWVIFAAVVSVLPAITDAFASQGGMGTQLPLGGLTMLNIGSKFINVAVPSSVGQAAVNIRFAQKCGVSTGTALSGGMVISVAGFLSQALVILYGLAIGVVDLDVDFSISGDDVGRILLIVIIVVAAVGLTFWSSQRLRHWYTEKVEPQLHEFRTGLTGVVSSPKRLLLLFGGNIGSQLLYGAVLAGCLHAYGASGSLLVLGVVANTAATLLGGLSPVPGGVGLWEGAAVAVLTAGGVDPTTATVAVLTHRMLTYYLPPLYGYFGFDWLKKHDYL
jgi:uncharacterized protein (TIRG00374 family)